MLEHLFEELVQSKQVHADFRLLLASFPTTDFPINVLSAAVKVTAEAQSSLPSLLRVCTASVFLRNRLTVVHDVHARYPMGVSLCR